MGTTEESKERILSNHFLASKNLTMDGMWVVLCSSQAYLKSITHSRN